MELPPTLEAVLPAIVFALGSAIGSFLNVVIYRLPLGESIVHPRSRCPHCGDMIPGWLNVPIVSWLVLRGRCRACRAPISLRYPMVEVLTGLLFLACFQRYGGTLAGLGGVILASALVVITFVDIDIWEIPDEISIPGVVVGCLLRPLAFGVPWYSGLAGAALGASFLLGVRWAYWLAKRTEGMGLGDVKLIAMIGAFLGPGALVPTILVASVAGSVVGVVLLLAGRLPDEAPPPDGGSVEEARESEAAPDPRDGGDEREPEDGEDAWVPPPHAVPFGPFLALGALTELLLGGWFARLLSGLGF